MDSTFDTSSLQPYKDAASSATNDVATQTASAPGMLNSLRQNLTSIFANDNPLISDRNTALQTFLNTPSQSRVSTLPSNLPTVAGSPLNLSPTQQDAITTAKVNAALVPLMGLNQTITGIYGNIPQLVQNAGGLYDALLGSAKFKASQAQTGLDQAFKELTTKEDIRRYQQDFAEKVREFNRSLAANNPNLLDYIAKLQAGKNGSDAPAGVTGAISGIQRPDLSQFDVPDQTIPQPTNFNLGSAFSNLGSIGGKNILDPLSGIGNSLGGFFNGAGSFLNNLLPKH